MLHLRTIWAVTAAVVYAVSNQPSELVKVIVLTRHGSRTPNPEMFKYCPNVNATMYQFGEPVKVGHSADLAQLGYAEMWELGQFLRHEYGGTDVLKHGGYEDDGSTYFYAQRANRNILSLTAVAMGLYPDGTGQKGLWAHRPNLIPILTTQPFHDNVMEAARDGLCKEHFHESKVAFRKKYQQWLETNWAGLLADLSDYCGTTVAINSMKDLGDFFELAHAYGLNVDAWNDLNHTTIAEVVGLAHALVKKEYVGDRQKVTYFVGDFFRLLESLLKPPETEDTKCFAFEVLGIDQRPGLTAAQSIDRAKLVMFGSHRELLMAIMVMLGMSFVQNGYEKARWVPAGLGNDFLEKVPDIPIGATLIWEQHRDVKTHTQTFFYQLETCKFEITKK